MIMLQNKINTKTSFNHVNQVNYYYGFSDKFFNLPDYLASIRVQNMTLEALTGQFHL